MILDELESRKTLCFGRFSGLTFSQLHSNNFCEVQALGYCLETAEKYYNILETFHTIEEAVVYIEALSVSDLFDMDMPVTP